MNTRVQRHKDRLLIDRHNLIVKMKALVPNYKPPADYKPPKLELKIPIPIDQYPDLNFMGLIIGPRGNTQKRLEKETGSAYCYWVLRLFFMISSSFFVLDWKEKKKSRADIERDFPIRFFLIRQKDKDEAEQRQEGLECVGSGS